MLTPIRRMLPRHLCNKQLQVWDNSSCRWTVFARQDNEYMSINTLTVTWAGSFPGVSQLLNSLCFINSIHSSISNHSEVSSLCLQHSRTLGLISLVNHQCEKRPSHERELHFVLLRQTKPDKNRSKSNIWIQICNVGSADGLNYRISDLIAT